MCKLDSTKGERRASWDGERRARPARACDECKQSSEAEPGHSERETCWLHSGLGNSTPWAYKHSADISWFVDNDIL